MTTRTALLARFSSPLVLGAAMLAMAGCDKEKVVVVDTTPQAITPDEGVVPAEAATDEMPEPTKVGQTGELAEGEAMIWVDPGADSPNAVTKAVVTLEPLGDSKVMGTIVFTAAPGGALQVKAEVEGLPANKHAYHVHVFGDCSSEDGKSAGTHFHFDGSSMNPPPDIKVITGNLGELEAGEDGKATAEATIEGASLQGKYSILGRSVIVHELGNDPSKPPMGGAGGRLACGVIGIGEL